MSVDLSVLFCPAIGPVASGNGRIWVHFLQTCAPGHSGQLHSPWPCDRLTIGSCKATSFSDKRYLNVIEERGFEESIGPAHNFMFQIQQFLHGHTVFCPEFQPVFPVAQGQAQGGNFLTHDNVPVAPKFHEPELFRTSGHGAEAFQKSLGQRLHSFGATLADRFSLAEGHVCLARKNPVCLKSHGEMPFF